MCTATATACPGSWSTDAPVEVQGERSWSVVKILLTVIDALVVGEVAALVALR